MTHDVACHGSILNKRITVSVTVNASAKSAKKVESDSTDALLAKRTQPKMIVQMQSVKIMFSFINFNTDSLVNLFPVFSGFSFPLEGHPQLVPLSSNNHCPLRHLPNVFSNLGVALP